MGNPILLILYYLIVFYQLLLIARIILSWVPVVDRYHPVGRFIWDLTEPVLRPVRNFLMGILPANFPLDLSTFIVLLLLSALARYLF